jgi:NDP-sugar pyrophosphorylase family protein
VYFDRVVISTSESNHGQIESVFGGLKEVLVEVDRHHTGPLGPQVRELLSGNGRAYGCAGDYFCRFDWESFEKFHDLVGNPASILTARSAVVPDGARFVLDHRGRVTGWKRVAMTESRDLINIGAYILDPSAASELVKLSRHKEDGFFDLFIAASKLAGYDPGVLGFNINTPDTYDQLCRFLNEGEDE